MQDGSRALIRSCRISGGQVGPARDCIAHFMTSIVQSMLDALVSEAAGSPFDFAIINILQGETKIHIGVDHHHTNPYNVMSMHGLLVWAQSGEKHTEELVFAPTVLSEATAEGIAACLHKRLPQLRQLFSLGGRNAGILMQDSFLANVKFAHSLLSSLPDEALGLFIRCMQHQTNLVVSPTTKDLAIVCLVFLHCQTASRWREPCRRDCDNQGPQFCSAGLATPR